MRLRTLTLPGHPNEHGVQPYLLVLDETALDPASVDLSKPRRDLDGCAGALMFVGRVALDDDEDDSEVIQQHAYSCEIDHPAAIDCLEAARITVEGAAGRADQPTGCTAQYVIQPDDMLAGAAPAWVGTVVHCDGPHAYPRRHSGPVNGGRWTWLDAEQDDEQVKLRAERRGLLDDLETILNNARVSDRMLDDVEMNRYQEINTRIDQIDRALI